MKAPFFCGETDLSIDLVKHRLVLPSDARRVIDINKHGKEIIVIVGVNGVLWLYPDQYYEYVVSQDMPELTPDDDVVAFNQLKFAMADRVTWEPQQGRMVLPERLLEETNTGGEVTLAGCGDHMELWNRDAWRQRRADLKKNRADIERRAKEARKNAGIRARTTEPATDQ